VVDETGGQHEAVRAIDEALAAIRGSSISELEVEWPDGSLRLLRQGTSGDAAAVPVEHPAPGDDRVVLRSEHVGTFFGGAGGRFPAVGAWIGAGTHVGEIETLGIRNVVTAGTDGWVEEVLVAEGAAVEYGQPLIVLRPDTLPPDLPSGDQADEQ
jgi:acetyl-CoA carboxylase biotin carboxyl carrier protein